MNKIRNSHVLLTKVAKQGQSILKHTTMCLLNTSREGQWSKEGGMNSTASLYVHWPYCEKRCTYCNFNKYISNTVDHDRMMKCLLRETNTLLQLSQVQKITSIFFGGGTPSLAHPATLQAVIQTVDKAVHIPDDAEITLEANPTSTEAAKLKEFQTAGVNRVSIGIQALDDQDLSVLGREHSSEEALRVLETAKTLFPGRTSIDLIFGRPGQTNDAWQRELEQILTLCDDHISLYQLTLERGTALFKKVMDRDLFLPSPDSMADMYEAAVEVLEENDFHRYEASNFARNKQAESSHNKGYWQGQQYIGVGPGAHGRFVPQAEGKSLREARIQTLEPDPWMYEVEKFGHATRKTVPLGTYELFCTESITVKRLQEILYLGLRTSKGISEEHWQTFSGGRSLQEVFGEAYIVRTLQDEGYLRPLRGTLRTTPRGLSLVDGITKELYSVLDKYWETNLQDGTSS